MCWIDLLFVLNNVQLLLHPKTTFKIKTCSGRNNAWGACRWAATLGIVLAVSRAFIVEPGTAFEPELALLETVAHTHYLPRHWRGRAHTREVQAQFQQLFQFKVGIVKHPAQSGSAASS